LTILAIDTSTQWCSVALVNPQGGSGQPQSPLSSGDLVRHENLGPESSQHALDWVEALLEEAQLNFRDLTVGIGQGMAFAADLPCLPIVCLDAVALEGIHQLKLKENDHLIVATDARMSEVYWARYVVQANGLPERQDDVYLSAPKDIDIPTTPFALVGNAVTAYPEDMLVISQKAIAIDETAVPHARSIAQLGLDALEKGLQVSAAELQPIYVRDKVAQTIAERELEKSNQEKS